MVKIIKEGNLDLLRKIVRFECDECGCVFEADKDSYEIASQYNEQYYKVKCPYCTNLVVKGYEYYGR